MTWTIVTVATVAVLVNAGVAVMFLDFLRTDREQHRRQIDALLARAGAPISLPPLLTNKPSLPDNFRVVTDETGFETVIVEKVTH